MGKPKSDPENYPEEREAVCSFCGERFRTTNRLHIEAEFCFKEPCIVAHVDQTVALSIMLTETGSFF